jgi:transcriptional regulator with XRE-family HTH domain
LPRIDTIERLACALGVPASWLAFGEQAGQPFRKRRPSPVLPPAAPEPVPEGLPYEGLHAGMAERLRSTREALGMSLRELSGPAQVSFEQIRKCEAGLTIARVDTCERLALALDVAPGWLAYGVGQGPARN